MPRKYPDEFRRRAIELVRAGQSVSRTAADLGITDACLYHWVKQDKIDRCEIPGRTTVESRELRKARRRIRELEDEVEILRRANAALGEVGIGVNHAAQLIVTAGENIDRLSSEASSARLCGVAPVPASSGNTRRTRLHKGGDRHANRSLHLIVVVRLRYDERSRDYMARRTAEGLSKKDVIRCLRRFVAREVFGELRRSLVPN